jgi:carbon monoxide dehydrogenase subunit G
MSAFTLQQKIRRPVSDVFAYLGDPGNTAEWSSAIVESRQVEDGAPGVGRHVATKANFLGKKIDTQEEVTAFDVDELLETKTVKGPLPMTIRFAFSPDGDGTLLQVSVDVRPTGPFRLMGGMVATAIKSQFGNDVKRMAELLERS